jgi:16S rRNA G966 N2-methylase RsmD
MAFKFRDLIVTVVPRGLQDDGSGSGGCVACSDAGSATVGSCTSECGVQCLDSAEVLEMTPYSFIDPPYQLELRQLLLYALTKSGVQVKTPNRLDVLEEQMHPQTIEEVEGLKRQFSAALRELEGIEKRLKAADPGNQQGAA